MMDNSLTIAPNVVMQDNKAEQLGVQAKVTGEPLTAEKRKQLKKISQDFESMFTGMMLKSMRATVPEDKLTGNGKAEETYRSLLDQEYATVAAKKGGTGSIASMVEKELLRRYAVPTRKSSGTSSEE
jgi:peptidoglycan hydrolase FlgJ